MIKIFDCILKLGAIQRQARLSTFIERAISLEFRANLFALKAFSAQKSKL